MVISLSLPLFDSCSVIIFFLLFFFFAFSYMSIIRAKIIQECACWKSSQAHHHSLKVTVWSINQWLPKRTSQPVIHKWVRHSTELLFDTLTLAFALTIAEILLQWKIAENYINRVKTAGGLENPFSRLRWIGHSVLHVCFFIMKKYSYNWPWLKKKKKEAGNRGHILLFNVWSCSLRIQ